MRQKTPFADVRGRRRHRGIRPTLLLLVLTAVLAVVASVPSSGAPPQSIWTGVERIVAVGDLHGDYDNFLKILQNKEIGLLDKNLHWIGGKTHLVQTGDIMDRGDNAKDILELMRKLEPEARKAGGMVHLLLGNHEELAIIRLSFDRRDYVRVNQFLSFLPETHRQTLINRVKKHDVNPFIYWNSIMSDEGEQTRYFDFFEENYGHWLAEHNVIIKINGVVFVHGGISLRDSQRTLDEINAMYHEDFQRFFRGETSFRTRMVYAGSRTPLWNRDLAVQPESDYRETLDQILANLGAQHIVVAHTPTLIGDDQARFGGRVYIIDTGISRVYPGGQLSALVITDGDIHFWKGEYHGQENKRDDGRSFVGFPSGLVRSPVGLARDTRNP